MGKQGDRPAHINPESTETSYQQLARILAQQIISGEWSAGSKLPPERELVERHHVSRATVRSALEMLEQQGLIRRVPARGTFVTARPNPHWASTASTILFLPATSWGPAMPENYEYYDLIHSGVKREASRLGLQVKAQGLRGYKHVPLEQYQPPHPSDVAGVIVCGTCDDRYIQMFRSEGVPVVVVDYWPADLETDCVAVDVESEACVTVEYLAQRGHSRLGFMAVGRTDVGKKTYDYDPDVWRLLDALRRGAQRRHVDLHEQWVVLIPAVRSGLEFAAQQLLSLRSRPTAVLCFDPLTAQALLKTAAHEGIRCPEDVSIISRGLSTIDGRDLTTFISDPELMGAQAVRMLIERRSGQRQHVVKVAMPSRLVVGTTTGPSPKDLPPL